MKITLFLILFVVTLVATFFKDNCYLPLLKTKKTKNVCVLPGLLVKSKNVRSNAPNISGDRTVLFPQLANCDTTENIDTHNLWVEFKTFPFLLNRFVICLSSSKQVCSLILSVYCHLFQSACSFIYPCNFLCIITNQEIVSKFFWLIIKSHPEHCQT